MPDSEALRAALRDAERAARTAHDLTEPSARRAAKELEEARNTIARWHHTLERGEWPGRPVAAYPPTPERILDGT